MPENVCEYCLKSLTAHNCTTCNGKGKIRYFFFRRSLANFAEDRASNTGVLMRLDTLKRYTAPPYRYLIDLMPHPESSFPALNVQYINKCTNCGTPLGNSRKRYCNSCEEVFLETSAEDRYRCSIGLNNLVTRR